jgi:hypothetical protein
MHCIRRAAAVASLLVLPALSASAWAQDQFPQTLYWGSGLIDIPAAWVAPMTGDFALQVSAQSLGGIYGSDRQYHGAAHVSLFGRAEVGVAAFSRIGQWGLYGTGLLLDESDFRYRSGMIRWLPSVAVGVRNVGPYGNADRFGLGYGAGHDPGAAHAEFDTAPTVFGAATRSFDVGTTVVSGTLGYGNGLFKDDGGLGEAYGPHGTGGVFGGVKADVRPGRNTVVSLMAENNAWDYNVGASVSHRGIRAGLYWLGIGGGSRNGATGLYDYQRVGFTLGWQSNVLALFNGDALRRRVAELEQERNQLQAQINARQGRIAELETEIGRYRAQNLLELEQRRQQAEQELKEEREALRRLEERLRRLEQGRPDSPSRP